MTTITTTDDLARWLGVDTVYDAAGAISKPFAEGLARALDEGRLSTRLAARVLNLAIEDFADLFAVHGIPCPFDL